MHPAIFRTRTERPRGAMISGCLLLVMVMAIVTTLAGKFAGFPPFHVLVATVTLVFALILARSADMRWQIEALAAVGVPAIISAVIGYTTPPDVEGLKGTSALLYLSGTVLYVLSCLVRGARAGRDGDPPTDPETEEHLS